MAKTEQAAKQARALFYSQSYGVLSTHSTDLAGYPFGSITPYCLDSLGQPVILISSIAQHTRNISSDNKVSLLCHDTLATDPQASARATYIGDAVLLNDEEMAERYYRYFPESRDFHRTHDFSFYTITLKRLRYIGGFGQIHWVEPDNFLSEAPFSHADENGMIEHMNHDHLEAIQHYCELFNIEIDADNPATLIGIDANGFHLISANKINRIEFEQAVTNAMEVRTALVELARKPK